MKFTLPWVHDVCAGRIAAVLFTRSCKSASAVVYFLIDLPASHGPLIRMSYNKFAGSCLPRFAGSQVKGKHVAENHR